MKESELKNFFFEKLLNCYSIVYDMYPDANVVYYYDEKFARKCKLSKINKTEIFQPIEKNYRCLFDQDLESEILFCDYDEIWTYFQKNYIYDHYKIKNLIEKWLNDDTTIKEYEQKLFSVKIKNRMKYISFKSYKVDFMDNF